MLHSIFGASGAHRWIPCPGSIQATERYKAEHPDYESGGLAADEGTLAHELCDVLVKNPSWPLEDVGPDWVIGIVKASHAWKDEYADQFNYSEMLAVALRYREWCDIATLDMEDPIVYSEMMVHQPRIHASAFGTNDHAIVDLKRRHVIISDLKYGSGIRVEVEGNMQVLQYAEGVRNKIKQDHGIDIKTYEGRIFQPRHQDGENIASWHFTSKEVNKFVMQAADAAARAELPEPPLNPGDKQCTFCAAKGDCKALAAYNYERIAGKFDDLEDALVEYHASVKGMSDSDLAKWLDMAKPINSWLEALKTTAHDRAMSGGKIPGYKLGLGRNSYKGDAEAIEFIIGDSAYKPKALKSKSELEKDLGRKRFAKLLEAQFEVVPGKPSLIPADSTKEEWKPAESAADAFAKHDGD